MLESSSVIIDLGKKLRLSHTYLLRENAAYLHLTTCKVAKISVSAQWLITPLFPCFSPARGFDNAASSAAMRALESVKNQWKLHYSAAASRYKSPNEEVP